MDEQAGTIPRDDPLHLSMCTCAGIRRAARTITQLYDEALRRTGLKSGQLTLLAALLEKGATGLGDLAEALMMDRTTLSRNLKPLVRDGLVVTGADTDQRVRVVALTDLGAERIAQAYPHWAEVQWRMIEGLGAEQWTGLIGQLEAAGRLARSDGADREPAATR